MLGISVELGTYSIKFISYHIDKKQTRLLSTDEILIEHHANQEVDHQDFDIWREQISLLKDYLDKIGTEHQVMMNIPSQIVTTRYIELPVKSKKKAIQMVPFQIEEDLPYSINECIHAETLEVEGEHTKSMIGIVKKIHFLHFFELLQEFNISPQVLTCDASNYAQLIKNKKDQYPSSFCILNFGHETTRGFYFHNGELVSNHQSYLAGDTITQAISKNYNIDYDEATLYKHQNSFLLLPEQYDQVNENQKEFAIMMDTTLALLISEIKRWDIGYRVKYGETIKEVYICGGTSNIKNIQNYLSVKLGVEVHFFNPYQYVEDSLIEQDEGVKRKFSQVTTLATNAVQRSKLINFLTGDYSLNSDSALPFEAMAFVSLRTAILSLILCVFFLASLFISNARINTANKTIKNLAKNPHLKGAMSPRTLRSIVSSNVRERNLKQLLTKLSAKERMIKQEVKTIQSALNINSFSSLENFISYLGGAKVELLKFIADDSGSVEALLKADSIAPLKSIKAKLDEDSLSKWGTILDDKKITLRANKTGGN